MITRKLTEKEINEILDQIDVPFRHIEVSTHILKLYKTKLQNKLQTITIKPNKISKLQKIIINEYYKSLIASGEAVGVNASQCIGEPVTQQTLNFFHHAGLSAKNVTLGFPRAKELFNATKNPSTPSCVIFFEKKNITLKETHLITDKICQIYFHEIVKKMNLLDNNNDKPWWMDIYLKLYPIVLPEEYKLILVTLDLKKLFNFKLQLDHIASIFKNKYTDLIVIPSPLNLGQLLFIINTHEIDIPTQNDDVGILREHKHITTKQIAIHEFITKIVYCLLKSELIGGIEGIKKLYPRKLDDQWVMDTDGTNLIELLAIDGIDTTKTISNDMWEIYEILGIEAVRNFLINEFTAIISAGGTKIDPEHIELLVDKMTYTGKIRAISRSGVETSQYGPITKITFEEVMSNLITSAIFSEKDDLNGISSNIALGKKIKAGTGFIKVKPI